MKQRDLQELTEEELQNHFGEVQQELFNLRVQKSTGQLENPARLRILRREIARINMLMHTKELTAP